MPVLRVDAHCTVVEAALKGYVKWRAAHRTSEVSHTPSSQKGRKLNQNRSKLLRASKHISKSGVANAWR
jgi:hypothetical protein